MPKPIVINVHNNIATLKLELLFSETITIAVARKHAMNVIALVPKGIKVSRTTVRIEYPEGRVKRYYFNPDGTDAWVISSCGTLERNTNTGDVRVLQESQ